MKNKLIIIFLFLDPFVIFVALECLFLHIFGLKRYYEDVSFLGWVVFIATLIFSRLVSYLLIRNVK